MVLREGARVVGFGRFFGMLRFLTAGESHGKGLVVIVEGLPAGVPVTIEELADELGRRRLGYGRGPRMRLEADALTLLAGVRHGRTIGAPVAIEIANSEWERKWQEEMSPHPGQPSKLLTQPRPGHADLAGMQKYGLGDARDVLERSSARETAARVAAGCLAKILANALGMRIVSHTIQIGGAKVPHGLHPGPDDLDAVDASQVRCVDTGAEEEMVLAIKAAAKDGDSLGGAAEVVAYGVPVGLGSYVQWDRRLDGLLAQALASIPAVKAVEIGDAIEGSALRGSQAHDAILLGGGGTLTRETGRAGGIEGGVSIGGPIIARAYMKPLSSLNRPVIKTINLATGEESFSFKERTDVTAVPAMGVVAEAVVALVLAGEALRKFGGDSLEEVVRNKVAYDEAVASQFPALQAGGSGAPLGRPPNVCATSPASLPAEPLKVVLVGMPGSGKSTVGLLVAKRIGCGFVDVDAEVERREGCSVAELFDRIGEEAFRSEERNCLARLLTSPGQVVIAPGGGAILDERTRAELQVLQSASAGCVVVWLAPSLEELARRVGDGAGRPLLRPDPSARLAALLGERERLYAEVAGVVVDTTGHTAAGAADLVVARLAGQGVVPATVLPHDQGVAPGGRAGPARGQGPEPGSGRKGGG